MARSLSFDGAFTALATPFLNGAIDFAAVDRLIEHQVKGGITGVVPVGTTGESPVLDSDEAKAAAKLVQKMQRSKQRRKEQASSSDEPARTHGGEQ